MGRLSPEEELLKLFIDRDEASGKSNRIDPRRIPKLYFGFPLQTIKDWRNAIGWFVDCLNNINGQTESFGKMAGLIIDIRESPEYFRINEFIDTLNYIGKKLGFLEQDVSDLVTLLDLVNTAVASFLQLQRELFRRGELAYPTGGILYPVTSEPQMKILQSTKVIGTNKAREIILKGLEIEEKMRNATTYAELRELQDSLERYSYDHLTDLWL
ncbi:hypothetical protein JCM16307_23390 [Thermococcus prieurii]